jgi:hypothetical protein
VQSEVMARFVGWVEFPERTCIRPKEHAGNETQHNVAPRFHSLCGNASECWVSFLEIARRCEPQFGRGTQPNLRDFDLDEHIG